MQSDIFVGIKTSFVGYHRWLGAPDEVAFLRDYHRHIFYVCVEMEVQELDRSLEFFMTKTRLDSFLNRHWNNWKFDCSCEYIANELVDFCFRSWKKDQVKACSVTVSEDNENYGKVSKRRDTYEF
jgi:hypothetical protein